LGLAIQAYVPSDNQFAVAFIQYEELFFMFPAQFANLLSKLVHFSLNTFGFEFAFDNGLCSRQKRPFFVKKNLRFMLLQGTSDEGKRETGPNVLARPDFGTIRRHALNIAFIECVGLATGPAARKCAIWALYQ
jgi:hypothetical protein